MEIGETLYVVARTDWRAWLADHYRSKSEIWLVYPRVHTGRPRIAYNDAVEEALCFGWIDSTVRALDADHTAQRFTPRKPRSGYSQTNKERLSRLIAAEQVLPDVLAGLEDVDPAAFEFPPDIMAALRADAAAWANFQRYSPAYQRIRVAYIDSARRRPEEFAKRLRNFLRRTAKDEQFGFGIEDYY